LNLKESEIKRIFDEWNGYIENQNDIEYLLPIIMEYYNDEFFWSFSFDTPFIVKLMKLGFLPMSLRVKDENGKPVHIFTPKLHLARCTLSASQLHIGKTPRRRSRGAILTINNNFTYIMKQCIGTHGDDWITAPLQDFFIELNNPKNHVHTLSIELWRDGTITAGEIGYMWGDIYTSLSGFTSRNGDGMVQMLSLGAVLFKSGIPMWDLGMPVDYKYTLGAKDISRKQFNNLVKEHATKPTTFTENHQNATYDCRNVLDSYRNNVLP